MSQQVLLISFFQWLTLVRQKDTVCARHYKKIDTPRWERGFFLVLGIEHMPEELSYVIINPTTIFKSRTGGVINRLLTRTHLDLVAARMFSPGQKLVEEYAGLHTATKVGDAGRVQKLIHDYVLKHFGPDPKTGGRKRVLVLLLKGEDAIAKVRAVVGSIRHHNVGGETIRDTYGDYVTDDSGNVIYFEPAVLAPTSAEEASQHLAVWTKFSDTDGGILDNVVVHQPEQKVERTLVLIKPDNFTFPTGRPGNIIDMFSRTGLYIVAFKVLRMSVAQAEDFYGPVQPVLREKLREPVAQRARAVLENEFANIKFSEETVIKLGDVLGPVCADHQFENIVEFMSGRRPSQCPEFLKTQAGASMCIGIMYEGPDAVSKIREVLGPTDPSKAPPGSIRREFGSSIMINAAHASDSTESSIREFKIVQLGENNFKEVVDCFYKSNT